VYLDTPRLAKRRFSLHPEALPKDGAFRKA